ncbi:AAA family ATPase [Lactobacillus gasseri]|jgi:AAA15 family ATPase/GTPase|uniref:AAA family ATPase n=1 Tax=Lactobacillus gasseri TaxID=1596 RepID=UPI00119283EB|nr:AAA family ATPase [Lactobacillus gasseri]TVU93439.1 ATP-binding protein [Lactobacillus gasseri]TVV17544.1 ATP-binding protein [Lactobacillus gasseri]UNL44749.1 ATP-binding protein [Lactobacillus gasseri]
MSEKTNKLYFLKMRIKNHPLFADNLEFSLMSDARVLESTKSQLTHLAGNLWLNNIITIVGKNATGKTTIMSTIIGMLKLLLYRMSIDQTSLQDIFIGSEPIKITTYFYGEDKTLYKDEITFNLDQDNPNKKWIIDNEIIYEKKFSGRSTKKNILNFKNIKPLFDRNKLGDMASSILSPDDSIFRLVLAKKKYDIQSVSGNLMLANVNALFYGDKDVPNEILNYLDPTIEYLKIEQDRDVSGQVKILYRLKFKNREEEINATAFDVIEHYLSSGTAKGITLYGNVIAALQTGGIIFVDELENHFNHAIVRSFIEDFSDPKVNINRAVLIFSTHYSELLDDLERGDEIYIAKRDGKIQLQRYSSSDVRSDLNKSDVFESDYLGGTAPEYSAYMRLKKATKKAVNDNRE